MIACIFYFVATVLQDLQLLLYIVYYSDRKNSFSFNSLIRRPKKKSSQEAADSRSPTPLQHPTTSASSESKHFR